MLDGNKVTAEDCREAVIRVEFDVLKDRKTTVCTLTLYNGFTVRGESSCVDPSEFNQALGEKYAEQGAREAVWPVLGAILAEKLYQKSLTPAPPVVTDPDERTPVEIAADEYLRTEQAHIEANNNAQKLFKARNEAAKDFLQLANNKGVVRGDFMLRASQHLTWGVEVVALTR